VTADDQRRVDEVVAASSLRMLESDFWSVGLGTQDDDFVSACLGGVDSPGRLAPMPGEVARGVSNVYLHQPDADARPEDGELVRLAVVVVDAANVSALDWFVVLLGDDETAECRRDEFLAAVELEPGVADLETAVDGDAVADIGIGERSARLDLRITFSAPGSARQVHYTHLVGRSGNTLVVLSSATFGPGPFSDFDPETELAAIVAGLGGT
jgi:hypothetical protein